MKKLIGSLLLLLAATTTLADTKISQLPLDSAAATNVNDSFPFVNSVIGETERLLLSDLINLPTMQSQFSLMVPSQTGQSGKCLQSNGTLTLWGVCSVGSVTSVGLLDGSTTPIYSLSGTPVTSTGTLTFSLMNQSANTVFVGPTTGAAAQPTFRLLVGADLPNPGATTLGGTESKTCSASNWLNQISTGGIPACSQPTFSDISSTLNLATQTTGTLGAGNGGTGQTSVASSFVSFYESIATTLGDLIYGGASGTPTRLAGNTTTTTKFLSQTGTGSVSAAPSWTQPACSNLSNAAASCSTDTTNAANISSGTIALARGGTNVDLSTTGGTSQVLKQNSSHVISAAQLAFSDISGNATVSQGGTGLTSLTAYAVMLGGTTSTGAMQQVSGLGTSGQVLTSNGASASPTWQASSSSVTSQSGTYSVLTSDAVVLLDATSAAFTATLPTAVGVTGKTYWLKKTDSSFNQVTIATTSSQTIDDVTTTKLSTKYENIQVISDGSNWKTVARSIPENWTAYTPTISGLGTVANVSFFYRRSGDSVQVQGWWTNGTVQASLCNITLPSGLSLDSSKITVLTSNNASSPFYGSVNEAQTNGNLLIVVAYNSSSTSVYIGNTVGSNYLVPTNGNGNSTSSASMTTNFTVPISGWSN